MGYLGDVWSIAMRWFMSLNTGEWFYVLLSTVAAGFFCMRGFGSRNGY